MKVSREHSPLMKLKPVPQNATVSIVAPASFARPERVESGIDVLRALGYTVRTGDNGLARGPLYFAGTPQQRWTDLHAAFADDGAQLVMCMRGGYGSNYLLGGLDLELIRRHPKPFFAYSDLTGIQLRLLDVLGLPAFHGPMAAADFYREDGVHLPSFRAALCGEPYAVGPGEGLRVLKHGTARGKLYGGCLSILVSLLGTPWEPSTEGKLLFLEDTGAKPYQVDRMLWQLRNAGKLEGVTGIVFGEMLDCASPGTKPEFLEEVIASALQDFEGPIAIGLRSGHVSRHNVTLTFGVTAEFEANEEAHLRLLETAVAP
ncbi:MAG TPA: LD-carboxypeptidase [Terracidiphilus sp.]|jgi:muramoyltetrapeptide carboxypeptidase